MVPAYVTITVHGGETRWPFH